MKLCLAWMLSVLLVCGVGTAGCGDDDDDDDAVGDGDADADGDTDADGDADADADSDADADADGDGDADCLAPEECPVPGSLCLVRTCDAGVCGTAPLDCSDGIACTDDACGDGVCVHAANPDLCDEQATFCDAAVGCVVPPQCDEQTPCAGAGDFCAPQLCVKGACVQGPSPCAGGVDCAQGCNEQTDSCTLDDGLCVDRDACTRQDFCAPDDRRADRQTGCVHTDVDPCDDAVACTTDSCEPRAGCIHAPEDRACPQDVRDACVLDGSGTCAPDQRGSDPATGCSYEPLVCRDDGVRCTTEECLDPDGCTSIPDDRLCDDGNVHTTDTCVGPRGGDRNGCVSARTCESSCAGETRSDCGPVACGYYASQRECVAACEDEGWDFDCFVVHSGHNMCVHFGQFCGLSDPGDGPGDCG